MVNCSTSCANLDCELNGDSWLNGVKFLLSLNLQGLRVCCPKCERSGTPISKWIKGPKVKPIYVFHKNGQGIEGACLLDENEAQKVRTQVSLGAEDIEALLQSVEAYVLFSGGVDSLCTLDYTREIASKMGKDVTAIHIDTTVGFPEVTEYVKRTCKELGVDLKLLTPEIDYFTLAKKWGIPAFNSRWCCRELKIKPVKNFLADMSSPKMVFDGIRAAESSIRAKYLPVWFHPGFNCLSVSPIFNWSDKEIQSYIAKKNLPTGPSFELGTSAECWCGAYKKKADFEDLYRLHPEIYNKLVEVEENNKHGFTFVYQNGKRISLEDLKKEIEDNYDQVGRV